MNDKRIVAVIPIKMKNERLPGKNTMPLGGKPLIGYIQESLLNVERIDDIYVFCSSTKICEFILPRIKFLQREQKFDLPTSNFTQIFEAFMSNVWADIYIYAHATAPFVSIDTIQECLKRVESGENDSAFCAVKIQDYLWKDGKALNFDPTNVPRSQDLEPIYRETSGVYVFKRSVFTELKRRIGDRPYIKEVSYRESVDINTKEDFEVAEMLLRYDEVKNE